MTPKVEKIHNIYSQETTDRGPPGLVIKLILAYFLLRNPYSTKNPYIALILLEEISIKTNYCYYIIIFYLYYKIILTNIYYYSIFILY